MISISILIKNSVNGISPHLFQLAVTERKKGTDKDEPCGDWEGMKNSHQMGNIQRRQENEQKGDGGVNPPE